MFQVKFCEKVDDIVIDACDGDARAGKGRTKRFIRPVGSPYGCREWACFI